MELSINKTDINQVSQLKVESLKKDKIADTSELRKMRIPRNKKYVKEIKGAASLVVSSDSLKQAIVSENFSNSMLGILGPCAIEGCIIHTLDNVGQIIEHYRKVEDIPQELQPGYEIYEQHPNCISVEVYSKSFCVVNENGSVKIIER